MTKTFNPLSPNSDQHQFSPNNIHTLSRNKVMRINEMITKEKMPRSFIKVSQLILKGNVWESVWRVCMGILGLKGLNLQRLHLHSGRFCRWLVSRVIIKTSNKINCNNNNKKKKNSG